MLTITLTGHNVAAQKLRAMAAKNPVVFGQAVHHVATEILALSRQYVPIDTGQLLASTFIDPPGETVKFGYGAIYARKVHENPRSGKTGGVSPSGRPYKHWAHTGQWKYLQTACVLMVPKANTLFVTYLRQAGVLP